MSREGDDDPKKLTVEEVLREFRRILQIKLDGYRCDWWEDNSEKRDNEISDLEFTRDLARKELLKLQPSHKDRGPLQDDWEEESCAVYEFRYPIPGNSGVEAYIKIGLKRHPKKRGEYV